MKVDIVFDVEFVPLLEKEEILKKLKEANAIDEKNGNTEASDELTKEFFNPTKNKIVSISYVMLFPNEKPIPEVFFDVDNESKVVNDFYDLLYELKTQGHDIRLVGYCINSCDIPIFKAKLGKYRKANRCNVLDVKPWETFDIYEKLGRKCKLEEWLDYYGLDGKYKGLTGEQFIILYLKDDQDTMKKYSMQDAISETQLFKTVENL